MCDCRHTRRSCHCLASAFFRWLSLCSTGDEYVGVVVEVVEVVVVVVAVVVVAVFY